MQAVMAFLDANWPYLAAVALLYFAWLFWAVERAPELPWHD